MGIEDCEGWNFRTEVHEVHTNRHTHRHTDTQTHRTHGQEHGQEHVLENGPEK